MFEELLELAKTGKPFTGEAVEQLHQLTQKQQEKIFKAVNKAKEEQLNRDINNEFKRVYKKLQVEQPEIAENLAMVAKVEDKDFLENYHDDRNYSLNEVLIAVYRDPETSPEMKEKVKERIYTKNVGLVFYVVKKFAAKNDGKSTMDDLGQECKLAFFTKVLDTFNLSKGFKFSTYCTTVLYNHMSTIHKNKLNKARTLEVSMETPIADDGGSIKTLLDYQVDPRMTPEEECRKEWQEEILYDVLNQLTLEQKFIAYCRYGLGNVPVKTQAEIADYMHMSQANVSKIEGIMRTKLLQLLNARDMF